MTASTIRQDPTDLTTSFSSRFAPVSPLNFEIDINAKQMAQSSQSVFDVARAGETAVKLSSDLVNALGSLNVKATGFGSTDIRDGIAEFRITGGAADLDTTKVELIHNGGLTLSSGQTKVDLTDFIITNLGDRTFLTGLVTVNNDLLTRAPLFDLTIGSVDAVGNRILNLDDVAVTLSSEAASTLNQVFGVSAFTSGFNIGTAEVEAFLRQPVRGATTPAEKIDRGAGTPIHGLAENTVFDVARGGETDVALSSTLVNALGSLNVQAVGFGTTDIRDGSAEFGIIGGAADLDTTKVELIHTGGLSLKAGDTTVDLSDFIISNLGDRTTLTGLVTVNGDLVTRAPLFDLQVGGASASTKNGRSVLDLSNVQVSLSSEAAGTLNQVFGVSAFTPGFNIGTANAEAFLRQPVQH